MIYTNGVIRTVIYIYLGSLLTVEVRLRPSYWKIGHKSWPQVITIEKIMSYHERLHPYTVLVGKTPLSCSHRLFFLWNDVEQNFCNYKECRYDVQYHALLHWNIFTQLSSLFKRKCCYMLLTQHGKNCRSGEYSYTQSAILCFKQSDSFAVTCLWTLLSEIRVKHSDSMN